MRRTAGCLAVKGYGYPELALVVLIGILWGLNWPAVKVILGEMPPWTMRAIGLGTGTMLLAGLAVALGQRIVPRRDELAMLVAAGLLSTFGFNVFTAFGQLLTETARAAIIAFTMPAWAALFSAIVLGERLGMRGLLALAIGMSGVGVLASEDLAGLIAAPLGPLFMLGAAISWAAGTVALKSRTWSIPAIARSAWLLGSSAVPVIAVALVVDRPWELSMPSTKTVWTFVYHVAGPMVFCHAAWVELVGRLPASVAALGTLLVPIVGVFSAVALLGDALTWQKLCALGLVLASIALTLRGPARTAG